MEIDSSLSNSLSNSSSRSLSAQRPRSTQLTTTTQTSTKQANLMQYPTRSGQTFHFDISRESCAPFGYFFGDRVKTPKKNKPAWVIGVWTSPQGQADLWFHIDGDNGASHWDGFTKTDFERKGFKLLYRPGPEERPERKVNPYNAPELESLLRDDPSESFPDITFKVGNSKIHAHKAILCARSIYFRAMFTLGMRESKQSEVEILDVDETSFRGMLHFLYTGNVDLSTNVFLLLVTAHKFQLDALSQLCYAHIDNHKLLSSDNVMDVIQIAREHMLTPLQNKCLEYILDNFMSLKHKFDTLDKDIILLILPYLEPTSRKNKDPSNTNLDLTTDFSTK